MGSAHILHEFPSQETQHVNDVGNFRQGSRSGPQEAEETAWGPAVRTQHSLPLELGEDIKSAILTMVRKKEGSLCFPALAIIKQLEINPHD